MSVVSRTKRSGLIVPVMIVLAVVAALHAPPAAAEHQDADPTFFARLSDNPSIPNHEKVNSRGQGHVDLVGSNGDLTFELSWRSLTDTAVAIEIRGEGSATGPTLVQLYGPPDSGAVVEGVALHRGSINGTIVDDDVSLEGVADTSAVSSLIWDELAERNGVVVVRTGSEPDDIEIEIVGVVRPRPVRGWIQL